MRTRLTTLLLLATLVALPGARALHAVDGVSLSTGDEVVDLSPKPCGEGTQTVCGTVTTQTCTSWKMTSSGGGFTIGTSSGTNYTITYSCEQWVTTTKNIYKNP